MNNDRILLSETLDRIGDAVNDIRETVGSINTPIEDVADAVAEQAGNYIVYNNEEAMLGSTPKNNAVGYCDPANLQWKSWDINTVSNILVFPNTVFLSADTSTITAEGLSWKIYIDKNVDPGQGAGYLVNGYAQLYWDSTVYRFVVNILRADGSENTFQGIDISYEGELVDGSDSIIKFNKIRAVFSKTDDTYYQVNEGNDTFIYDAPLFIEDDTAGEYYDFIGNFIKTPITLPNIVIPAGEEQSGPYKCLVIPTTTFTLSEPFVSDCDMDIYQVVGEETDPYKGTKIGTLSIMVESTGSTTITLNYRTAELFSIQYASEDGIHFELLEHSCPVIRSALEGYAVMLAIPSSNFPLGLLPQIFKGIPYKDKVSTYVYMDGAWASRYQDDSLKNLQC